MKTKHKLFILFLLSVFFLVSCKNEVNPDKNIHVVVTGIDYTKTNREISRGVMSHISYLEKCIDDAVQVGKCIQQCSVENCDVVYLMGSDESKMNKYNLDEDVKVPCLANFREVVNSLKERAKSQDVTIFYFSCHGDLTEGSESDPNYKKYDSDVTKYGNIALLTEDEKWYELYRIDTFFNDIRDIPGIKVVLGDFCYSGSLIPTNGITVNKTEYPNENIFDVYFKKKIDADSSIFCLSAAEFYNKSYDGTNRHGRFTEILLNSFGWDDSELLSPKKKGNKATQKKYITLSDIAAYVYKNGGIYKGTYNTQTPVSTSYSSDVVLFNLK